MHLSGIPAKEWLISNKELLILNPFIPSITQWGAGGFFFSNPIYIQRRVCSPAIFSENSWRCWPWCANYRPVPLLQFTADYSGKHYGWKTGLTRDLEDYSSPWKTRSQWLENVFVGAFVPRSRAYPGESEKKKKLYYVLFYSHFYDIND